MLTIWGKTLLFQRGRSNRHHTHVLFCFIDTIKAMLQKRIVTSKASQSKPDCFSSYVLAEDTNLLWHWLFCMKEARILCVGAQEQLSVVQNEEMLCKHLLCAHYFAFMYIILSSPLFRLPVVLSTGLWSRCIAAAWHDSSLSIVSNSSSLLLLFSSSVIH